MALLSKWRAQQTLIAPCFASGPPLIEAAMIAKNIAPGVHRKFVSETWTSMDKKIWDEVSEGAEKSIKKIP